MALAAELLGASDPPDLNRWRELSAHNLHLRISNRAPVLGLNASIAELSVLFARVAALGRGFQAVWPAADGETILMELDVLPLRGGPALPIALVIRKTVPNDLLGDLRFYLDASPLQLETQTANSIKFSS
jgi:hypothetical protein